jgi:hypothetical protein
MNAARWHKLGFVLFTREYCAGIITGIGLGTLLAIGFIPVGQRPWPLLSVPWFCMAAGGTWARATQKKCIDEENAQKAGSISN